MTLIEFLSYGLTEGQKVTLQLSNYYDDQVKPVTCFFAGFRNRYGRPKAHDQEDIIPVFHQMSANGRRLSKLTSEYTDLKYIRGVSAVDAPPESSGAEESRSIRSAVRNLEDAAFRQVKEILREMDMLFPGKKVFLDNDFNPATCVRWNKHCCFKGYIKAAGWKDGEPVFDLSMEMDLEKGLTIRDFDVFSYQALRCQLLDAIASGSAEDDSFFDPSAQSYKDIPTVDPGRFPVLHGCGALDRLRSQMWFDSLSPEQKEKCFEPLRNRYERFAKDEATDFPSYVRSFWKTLSVRERMMFVKDGE